MAGENVVHVADVTADPDYQSDIEARARTSASGSRSILTVALRKDDRLLGAITTGGARCGLTQISRSHCCRISLHRRLLRWRMRDCSTKSASVRPNCGRPSTTWQMAWLCSMSSYDWQHGIATSSRSS